MLPSARVTRLPIETRGSASAKRHTPSARESMLSDTPASARSHAENRTPPQCSQLDRLGSSVSIPQCAQRRMRPASAGRPAATPSWVRNGKSIDVGSVTGPPRDDRLRHGSIASGDEAARADHHGGVAAPMIIAIPIVDALRKACGTSGESDGVALGQPMALVAEQKLHLAHHDIGELLTRMGDRVVAVTGSRLEGD